MPLRRQNALTRKESQALTRLKILKNKNSVLEKKNRQLQKEINAAKERVKRLMFARQLRQRVRQRNVGIPSVRSAYNRESRIRKLSN
jgi:hypothetical protein